MVRRARLEASCWSEKPRMVLLRMRDQAFRLDLGDVVVAVGTASDGVDCGGACWGDVWDGMVAGGALRGGSMSASAGGRRKCNITDRSSVINALRQKEMIIWK